MLWWLLSSLLIVFGIAGTVLPALPGTGLILAGIVLAAWIDDFTRIGTVTIAIVTALAVLSWVLEYLAGIIGARQAGASRQAIIGAALGMVLGLMMGLIGVFVMPLVGAAAGEFLARRDHRRSVSVGFATWFGMMVGMLAKVVLAFMMVGVFIGALLI